MTLSIESVAIIVRGTVECLDREIEESTILDFADYGLSDHLLLLDRVVEMVLPSLKSMVDADHEAAAQFRILWIGWDEAASDHWLPEALYRLGLPVEVQQF